MAFELFKDICTLLSTVKKGARLAKQFGMLDSQDEKGQSKGFMGPDFNFDSRLQSARLNMQTMDAPRGMALPRMDATYTYFKNNLAKEKNIRQIQQTNIPASRPRGRPVQLGSMTSTRKSQVDRTIFRQRRLG